MRVKGRTWRLAVALGLGVATAVVLAVGPSPAASTHVGSASAHEASDAAAPEEQAFRDAVRRLWVDHVTWTRLFIVSFAADLPDLPATTERLLRNQSDIGASIVPFYGEAAGDELTSLLEEHILTAAGLLQAAKEGDDVAFQETKDAWYRNAREIARFLHEANPEQWPLRDLRQMMRDHLDLTLAEAAAQLGGDYARSVALYDEVEDEILHMADMLASGLIARFPERFA
jgi:hypothetical protein